MCQPGRPFTTRGSPSTVKVGSQKTSPSPGTQPFQSAKSPTFSFSYSSALTRPLPPARTSACERFASSP